jgi:hypothetical protein
MSDTRTIREAIRQANMDAEYDLNNSASTLITLVLGLDPQMPVETLKRRLLWGERVEELARQVDKCSPDSLTVLWLTREES